MPQEKSNRLLPFSIRYCLEDGVHRRIVRVDRVENDFRMVGQFRGFLRCDRFKPELGELTGASRASGGSCTGGEQFHVSGGDAFIDQVLFFGPIHCIEKEANARTVAFGPNNETDVIAFAVAEHHLVRVLVFAVVFPTGWLGIRQGVCQVVAAMPKSEDGAVAPFTQIDHEGIVCAVAGFVGEAENETGHGIKITTFRESRIDFDFDGEAVSVGGYVGHHLALLLLGHGLKPDKFCGFPDRSGKQ